MGSSPSGGAFSKNLKNLRQTTGKSTSGKSTLTVYYPEDCQRRFFQKRVALPLSCKTELFKIDVSQLKKCLMDSWISETTIAAVRLSLQRFFAAVIAA